MVKEQYKSVIEALNNCAITCNECYDECLTEENVTMMVDCIRLERECAEFSAFVAQALARGTAFASEYAELCIKICEACGNECMKHASHMESCKKCADTCFKCADECRKLLS
ncbi:four-helix bundle copper-binding protein [Exiguobacterium alkaliphilum]|uniref:four-helix bundle copper-binding protein n=1 Tax=Exiguobacterium alkaliphilum TaxID=1428684 RepID=UPI001BABC31A|nr:four-helix bundle copper-binding protein [Exiguobacterium alkaliphilum]QUE85394.1 four-helix bundle copper-binding protein [Exiguobacterium alkaliphilum]